MLLSKLDSWHRDESTWSRISELRWQDIGTVPSRQRQWPYDWYVLLHAELSTRQGHLPIVLQPRQFQAELTPIHDHSWNNGKGQKHIWHQNKMQTLFDSRSGVAQLLWKLGTSVDFTDKARSKCCFYHAIRQRWQLLQTSGSDREE